MLNWSPKDGDGKLGVGSILQACESKETVHLKACIWVLAA